MYKYYPIRFRVNEETKNLASIEAIDTKTCKIEVFTGSNINKLANSTGFNFNEMKYNGSSKSVKVEHGVTLPIGVYTCKGLVGVIEAIDKTKSESCLQLTWMKPQDALKVCYNTLEISGGDLVKFYEGNDVIKEGVYGKGISLVGIRSSYEIRCKAIEKEKTKEESTGEENTNEESTDEITKKLYGMEEKDVEIAKTITEGISGGKAIHTGFLVNKGEEYRFSADVETYILILKRLYEWDSITIPFEVYSQLRVYMEDTAIKTNLGHTKCTYIATIDLGGLYVSGVVSVDEDKPVKLVILKRCSFERMNKGSIVEFKKKYTKWFVTSERIRYEG